MVDDYEGVTLASKFREFPYASRVIEWERDHNEEGKINIERLLTRLEGRMPYDFYHEADEELGMLLAEVKRRFLTRIRAARDKGDHIDDLRRLAKHCLTNRINCITFNYDDVLDEALFQVTGSYTTPPPHIPYWSPDGGYGFFCRPSLCSVEDTMVEMDLKPAMFLLKLHGSLNWHAIRGYAKPYAVDAIMHHETWYRPRGVQEASETEALHIETDPFLVPPVLVKSAIVEQPILRLLWHRAYNMLSEATEVTFVGYSCPVTDIAVRTLFEESLQLLPGDSIHVINSARNKTERQKIINAYREVFADITDEQFDFKGALRWARALVQPTPKPH